MGTSCKQSCMDHLYERWLVSRLPDEVSDALIIYRRCCVPFLSRIQCFAIAGWVLKQILQKMFARGILFNYLLLQSDGDPRTTLANKPCSDVSPFNVRSLKPSCILGYAPIILDMYSRRFDADKVDFEWNTLCFPFDLFAGL